MIRGGKAWALTGLFATLTFVLFHLAVVGPIAAPVFELLRIPALRAPLMEEAAKLLLCAIILQRCSENRNVIAIVTVGIAAGLGESLINILFRYDALFDMLAAETAGEFSDGELHLAAFLAFIIKFLTASFGHTAILFVGYKAIVRKNYPLAYLLLVTTHFFLNTLLTGPSES